jgi:hypothetical protein
MMYYTLLHVIAMPQERNYGKRDDGFSFKGDVRGVRGTTIRNPNINSIDRIDKQPP